MSRLDPSRLYVDPRKVREYLLAPDHPEGGSKAAFFLGLGFDRDRPWELALALRELAATVEGVHTLTSLHGTKHVADGVLRGSAVRTVWIVDPGSSAIRLVTAYPRRLSE